MRESAWSPIAEEKYLKFRVVVVVVVVIIIIIIIIIIVVVVIVNLRLHVWHFGFNFVGIGVWNKCFSDTRNFPTSDTQVCAVLTTAGKTATATDAATAILWYSVDSCIVKHSLRLGFFWPVWVSEKLICKLQQLYVYEALLWLLLPLFCVACEFGFHLRVCESDIY